MASNYLKVIENMKDDITCPVCLDILKDPQALSCLHTLCRQCAEDIGGTSQNHSIQCPTCRKATAVEDLQKDFRSVRAIENYQKMVYPPVKPEQKPSTNICQLCEEKAAVYKCRKCNRLTCQTCRKVHVKMSKCQLKDSVILASLAKKNLDELKEWKKKLKEQAETEQTAYNKTMKKMEDKRQEALKSIDKQEDEALQHFRNERQKVNSNTDETNTIRMTEHRKYQKQIKIKIEYINAIEQADEDTCYQFFESIITELKKELDQLQSTSFSLTEIVITNEDFDKENAIQVSFIGDRKSRLETNAPAPKDPPREINSENQAIDPAPMDQPTAQSPKDQPRENQTTDPAPTNQTRELHPENKATDPESKNQHTELPLENQATNPTQMDLPRELLHESKSTDQLPKDQPREQLTKNKSTDQLPKDQPREQLTKNKSTDQLPKDQPREQLTKNKSTDQLPKDQPREQLTQNQATVPTLKDQPTEHEQSPKNKHRHFWVIGHSAPSPKDQHRERPSRNQLNQLTAPSPVNLPAAPSPVNLLAAPPMINQPAAPSPKNKHRELPLRKQLTDPTTKLRPNFSFSTLGSRSLSIRQAHRLPDWVLKMLLLNDDLLCLLCDNTTYSDSVEVYDPTNGQHKRTLATGLKEARSMTITSRGQILIATLEEGLLEYTLEGERTKCIDKEPHWDVTAVGEGAVALRRKDGVIHIDEYDVRLQKIRDTPTSVVDYGGRMMCTLASGSVYICSERQDCIYKLDANTGKNLQTHGSQSVSKPGYLNHPFLCCTDGKILVIADYINNRLQTLDCEKNEWKVLNVKDLKYPHAAVVDRDGRLLVAGGCWHGPNTLYIIY